MAKGKNVGVIVIAFVSATLILALMIFGAYKLASRHSRQPRKPMWVKIVRPPVKPKDYEPPPPPEIKEQEIKPPEEVSEESAQEEDPGEALGLATEGGFGTDGFGLVAKPKGKPLIGGSDESQVLIKKYAWYLAILERDIHRTIRGYLDGRGGMPDGDHKAIIEVSVDARGTITSLKMHRESQNKKVNEAITATMKNMTISEPPPMGMPKKMKIQIRLQSRKG
jgi:hypothetical protein